MKDAAFFFCALWIFSHTGLGQTINTNHLRRDETLQYDEIALKFSAVCRPTVPPPTRTLGLGLDRIRFLDSGSNALFSIDVGTSQGSYYLGEGWYFNDPWPPNLNMCWANGLATQSMIHCHIPQGSAYIEFTATTACNPITTEVRVNGQLSGSFSLPAYADWRKCLVRLPQELYRHLDYTLLEGGPLQVGSIDWISAEGAVVSSVPTVCTLNGPGSTASFTATVPAGVGDFQLRLTVPPPVPSRLRVSVNNSSALIPSIPTGSNWVSSAEPDALERQADKRTREAGWGEDFNARKSGFFFTWPNFRYTDLECDGDVLKMPYVEGETSVQLTVSLPEALPIVDFPYLSVKLRASKGAFYCVRPVWYDDQNRYVPLWFDEAPTEWRMGAGDWETLTVSLPRLVRVGGSPATMVSAIDFPLYKRSATNATLEFDWVRVHKGFLPNPENRTLTETNFANHLDDDGDGLTDMDDFGDFKNVGFPEPLVLSHYHVYYGSRFDASAEWLGWKMPKQDVSDPTRVPTILDFVWDPDTYDPLWPGKRNISSPYYPLNCSAFPDYVPPANGHFDYATFGGLETYDCLNSNFVRNVLTTAKHYGIDGFVANSTATHWPFQDRIDLAGQCGLSMDPSFLLTVLYDGYQGYLGNCTPIAKSDYSIAMELMFFFNRYRDCPNWLRYGGRPIIMPIFRSDLIPLEKWQRVKDILRNPKVSEFDGLLHTGPRQPFFGNKIVFSFGKAECPTNGDQRILAAAFDYVQFYGPELEPLNRFDFGGTEARPHLLSGWSWDEVWGRNQTVVWAVGTQRWASIEVPIPTNAWLMEVACLSYPVEVACHSSPSSNTLTVAVNSGNAVTVPLANNWDFSSRYFRLLDGLDDASSHASLPFALFLDSDASKLFDGYASYSPNPYQWGHRIVVSDGSPVIVTVGCGTDDRKVRSPGYFVDREDGAYYRRQWEAALAGEPDVVIVGDWNEWYEGNSIEPSVEYGYKYVELTLTYSLIFRGKMLTSVKPSAMDLTVRKYAVNPDGQSEIRLSATNQGTVIFTNLSCDHLVSFQVLRDGLPFDGFSLNSTNATLTLNLLNSTAEYRVSFVRDAVPPVGSVWINDGAGYTDSTNVVLNLVASDNRGTVAGARYSNDGSNWTGWEGYTTNKSWSLTLGDGPKTVFVQFKDDMGNIATSSATITVGRCWFESISRRSNGVVDLKFTGVLGGRYRIDAATNLGAWFPLMMVTNTSRTITNADESATNSQRRFYRAVQQ